MIIKTFPMGMISANAYLLIDEESKEAGVIDIGGDFSVLKDELQNYNANLKFILNTHGHFDHCNSTKYFQEKGRMGLIVFL